MKHHLITIFLTLLLLGCNSDYTPKPRGYFRIDLPSHEYQQFDTTFPFSFEVPIYATTFPDTSGLAEPYWINVGYPAFRAQLHISYKEIHHNLSQYLEDSRTLVNKHIPKANAITQQEFLNPEAEVYGLTFSIRGTEAASPYQFYLTDSLTRFVRGALYFNIVPNNDSLAPVIDFLRQDIDHMISTFRWKY
ncbi:MAG: gliding motility lipoprotein GldD [Bacteroidetes bacterium]|nr:MAG: gliding motility lipoprotein GldD [Bacteroidota bacterium]